MANTFTGTGNWSTPARWSGGVPATNDDVIIAGACTVDANTNSLKSFVLNAGATLAGSSSITVIGAASATNITLTAGATVTYGGTFNINPTAGGTITAALGGYNVGVTINGAGTVVFTQNFALTNKLLGISQGVVHFDGANDNLGLSHTFYRVSSSGSAAITLYFGAATYTLSNAGARFGFTGTNQTLYASSATVNLQTNTPIGVNFGSTTWYKLVYNTVLAYGNPGGSGLSGCTFTDLTCNNNGQEGIFQLGSFTVNGALVLSGVEGTGRTIVSSSTLGTPSIITCNGTVSVSHCSFQDITFAGTADWDLRNAAGGSGDCGGNSGNVQFTTAATQTWTNGGEDLLWGTPENWTSRVPLPQDDVIINTNYGIEPDRLTLGKNLTISNGGSLQCTGEFYFFGSLDLTGSGAHSFPSRWLMKSQARSGTLTITSAGKTLNGLCIDAYGTTVLPMDAFTITGTGPAGGSITNGTFGNSTFSTMVTLGAISLSSPGVLNMGNANWVCVASGDAITIYSGTCNPCSSTIVISNTSGGVTFSGITTLNDVLLTLDTSKVSFQTGTTVRKIMNTRGTSGIVYFSSTCTISSICLIGTAAKIPTIGNASFSGVLTKAVGGSIVCDYVQVIKTTISQAANAGIHSPAFSGTCTGWALQDNFNAQLIGV